jgi:preprotein translocase subunit SecA
MFTKNASTVLYEKRKHDYIIKHEEIETVGASEGRVLAGER